MKTICAIIALTIGFGYMAAVSVGLLSAAAFGLNWLFGWTLPSWSGLVALFITVLVVHGAAWAIGE